MRSGHNELDSNKPERRFSQEKAELSRTTELKADDVKTTSALEAEIEAKVKKAGTSFYWGMRMLAAERRAAMYAVYAFCRDVDDIADEENPSLSPDARGNCRSGGDDLVRLYVDRNRV